MDIDANALIAEITAQRNSALDQVAALSAVLKQVQNELAELKNE